MKTLKYLFILLFLSCSKSWSVSPIEFQRATLNGETQIVVAGLKEKGYEYVKLRDKDHNTPLHLASCAKKGGAKAEIISLLLKYGAEVNATNKYYSTPLYIAAATNNLEGAKILLRERGILVNLVSSSNMTPLMAAMHNRSTDMMSLLLAHPETDPNWENSDGLTPLHLASKWGYAREVALLLNDPRTFPEPKQPQGDFTGATPLHYACMQAHPDVVKLLLKQKDIHVNAPVEEGIYEGFTPVHYTVMNPKVPEVFKCLQLLVQAGAQVNLKSKSGKKPSDLTTVRVILEFLADPNPNYELKQKKRPSS